MSRMRYTAAGAVGATQHRSAVRPPPAPLPPKRRPTYVVALAPDLALLLWMCKGTHQDQFFVTLNSTQYKVDLPPSSSRPFPPIPILVHDTHRHTSSLHSSPKTPSLDLIVTRIVPRNITFLAETPYHYRQHERKHAPGQKGGPLWCRQHWYVNAHPPFLPRATRV